MSRTISAGIGKPYGLERVCRVLGFPRSTIYAARMRESSNVVPLAAQRRGHDSSHGWAGYVAVEILNEFEFAIRAEDAGLKPAATKAKPSSNP